MELTRFHLGTLRVAESVPTSACRSGDQSVDPSHENEATPTFSSGFCNRRGLFRPQTSTIS